MNDIAKALVNLVDESDVFEDGELLGVFFLLGRSRDLMRGIDVYMKIADVDRLVRGSFTCVKELRSGVPAKRGDWRVVPQSWSPRSVLERWEGAEESVGCED